METEQEQQTAPAPTPRRRWFHFTRLELVLVVLLVCVVGVLCVTQYRLEKLRDENSRLRMLAGIITVEDPAKLHVKGLTRVSCGQRWEWSFHIPTRSRYRICSAFHNIPVTGFPPVPSDWRWSFKVGPWNSTCQICLVEWGDSQELNLEVDGETGLNQDSPVDYWKLVPNRSLFDETGVLFNDPVFHADVREKVALLRWRAQRRAGNGWVSNPEPCDGLMVWLEPDPRNGNIEEPPEEPKMRGE